MIGEEARELRGLCRPRDDLLAVAVNAPPQTAYLATTCNPIYLEPNMRLTTGAQRRGVDWGTARFFRRLAVPLYGFQQGLMVRHWSVPPVPTDFFVVALRHPTTSREAGTCEARPAVAGQVLRPLLLTRSLSVVLPQELYRLYATACLVSNSAQERRLMYKVESSYFLALFPPTPLFCRAYSTPSWPASPHNSVLFRHSHPPRHTTVGGGGPCPVPGPPVLGGG